MVQSIAVARRRCGPATPADLHRLAAQAQVQLVTKSGAPIVLRRPTPVARPRVVRSDRCPVCLTRGGSLDPECAGHPIAGGVLFCGCPRCGTPDLVAAKQGTAMTLRPVA